jgi:hypothetical protein
MIGTKFYIKNVFLYIILILIFIFYYNTPSNKGGSDNRWYLHTTKSIVNEGNLNLNEYKDLIIENNYYTIHIINNNYYNYFPYGNSIFAIPFYLGAKILGFIF